MKIPLSALMGPSLLAFFLVMMTPVAAPAMGGTPDATGAESSAQAAAQTAAQTAGQNSAQDAVRTGAQAGAQAGPRQEARPPAAQAAPAAQGPQDGAIVISNNAPGYNGYAGTWRDPETGDIVTSVIAPRRAPEQAQQQPIYIAPQIDPLWPANGYGNQGWNGGWQPGGNTGWNNGWAGGAPGWTPGGGQAWRPGQQGPVPPGTMPPGQAGPAGSWPPPAMTPSQPAQPGVPPQQPEKPGPGGLPLPDMQPGMQPGGQAGVRPPQAGLRPAQPGTPMRPPVNGPQGAWQGNGPGTPPPPPPNGQPPNGDPQNWQNGIFPPSTSGRPSNWQPQNWQPAWQGSAGEPGAWRPWGPAGTSAGIKAWTPGQPPHGDWQPLSWSPAGAWNPWQRPPAPMRTGQGTGPGMRGRFAAMPMLPPNITRHLGPVVPLGQRGGPR